MKTTVAPSYLPGRWSCVWRFDFPEGAEAIRDKVRITRADGGSVEGESNTEGYGRCLYTGHEHAFTVSLSYRGVGPRKQLVGVVLLKRNPGSYVLEGRWLQFTSRSEIAAGTTTWTKLAT